MEKSGADSGYQVSDIGGAEMIPKHLTEEEVLRRLKSRIKNDFSSQKDFAESVQVSAAFVSAVLNGRKRIPSDWLAGLGVARLIQVTYFEVAL